MMMDVLYLVFFGAVGWDGNGMEWSEIWSWSWCSCYLIWPVSNREWKFGFRFSGGGKVPGEFSCSFVFGTFLILLGEVE